jgi:polysaccharide export outer membrane protein
MATTRRTIPIIRSPLAGALVAGAVLVAFAATAAAQATASKPQAGTPTGPPAAPASVATPPDYVIGPDDILTIVVWREKDLSGDVGVRPDGKISLPLVNDVHAAGLTPDQLRVQLTELIGKIVEEPTVTVVVKGINSRKVFITGQVTTPGAHVLTGPLTVMQLISLAGGLTEFAKKKDITVMRTEADGKQIVLPFNYNEVSKGRSLSQNVVLKPGDTVVVP